MKQKATHPLHAFGTWHTFAQSQIGILRPDAGSVGVNEREVAQSVLAARR